MNRSIKRYQSPKNGFQYITSNETRQELNPFMFFDAGTQNRNDDGMSIGMHPHSGIAIITYFEGVNLNHNDSGGNLKEIKDGGLQWINSGGGIFHNENYVKKENTPPVWPMSIYQLWLQLPPELEESGMEYMDVQPEDLPIIDHVKILIGSYKGKKSPVKVPYNMTYLDISLKSNETFQMNTPKGQSTGFIFPTKGILNLHEQTIKPQHLSVLENKEGLIKITAKSDAKFVLIMSEPQDYPIITHRGSIHTNEASMNRSIARINEIKF